MKFDGIDLSNVIEIHDIKRDVGNTRNVVSSSALKIGEHVQSVHVGAKKISVDFSIWTRNRNEVKHNLAKVFNRTTPRKLFFSDEPDKYYMAIVVDDIPMVEDVIKRSIGTITFLIPDGVAHSTTYKKFLDYTQDGNKLIFKLQNEGNTNALPIIKIKHNSENGYIGIANETGAFALGSSEEEDGTIVHRNEVLFDYSKAIAKALEGAPNVAKLNHMPPSFDTELKRMRIDNILGSGKGGEYVVIGNRGTTPGYTEHVGTRTFIINPDSNGEYTLNEHLWWQQIFIATAQDQKGFLKLCVTGIDDEGNDEFLYGIETYKRKNGFEAEYNFFALDDDGVGWRFYKQFEFQADRNYHNPFSMDRSRAVEIFREEDKFRIYFNGA
ncbi:TPA: phage tail family protein, partial [Streptococcus agalactiae]|nr:phage tail family protein [Streptococcus agalactiae]